MSVSASVVEAVGASLLNEEVEVPVELSQISTAEGEASVSLLNEEVEVPVELSQISTAEGEASVLDDYSSTVAMFPGQEGAVEAAGVEGTAGIEQFSLFEDSKADEYSSTLAMFTDAMFSPVMKRRPLSPDSELELKRFHEDLAKAVDLSLLSDTSSSAQERSPPPIRQSWSVYPKPMTFNQKQNEITKRLIAENELARGFNEQMLVLIKSSASLIFFDTPKEMAQTCSAVVANIREVHWNWAKIISPMVITIIYHMFNFFINGI